MRGELTPNTTPLVSVIVPVYNVRPYLDQCLASIAAQTCANIEVIVVDDGSTDGGGAVCDGWATKDQRFRVIHQQNWGLSAARNAGLDIARGEYLQFVDSDDYVVPRFTEALLQAARETGCPCAICGYETHRAHGTDSAIPTAQPVVLSAHGCMQRMLTVRAKDHYRIGHTAWNRIYRRSLFYEHNIRFPEGRVYEDVWITAPVLHHSGKIALIPDACLRPRRSSALTCTAGVRNNVPSSFYALPSQELGNPRQKSHDVSVDGCVELFVRVGNLGL